jgi:hypothetical protein
MTALRLTDAQVSRALRAHLPDRAQAGLRERIFEAAERTSQQRALPSFLGALSDADPVTRRRSLLIAAALLVALALAATAAVGAFRLLERDPFRDLSLEPPADLPAFVLSSYQRLPELPPVALTWRDDDGPAKGRIYVDRSGAVRFDRFASADATEPSSYTILSDHRISGIATVGSDKVWVEQGHEAFGDDPRVFLRTVLSPEGGPGCEMERDANEVENGTAAAGWRYVGVEHVAGRPAHHVACVEDLWLDIETRLILRIRAPLTDEAGQPVPGQFATKEITEIAFGEQPAALFEAPEGVVHMTSEAYSAYLCTRDLRTEEEVGFGTRECAPPPEAEATPEATPLPTPTPKATARPSPSGPAGPLAWTPASLKEDWPAPVRLEPAGGAIVVPLQKGADGAGKVIPDPLGDTGSAAHPWVDIQELQGGGARIIIDLASNLPPLVAPTEQWIAYGVVVDDDRDGIPDRRFGIDNIPGTAPGKGNHRAWITDLHTGRTVAAVGAPYGAIGETRFDTFFPGEWPPNGAWLQFGGAYAGGGGNPGLVDPFYAWASVIVDGRVVATDYAPDVGWLVEANP